MRLQGTLLILLLAERGHRMILRMGIDSLLVLGTYLAGVAVLFSLR